jgi:hypothetical protein
LISTFIDLKLYSDNFGLELTLSSILFSSIFWHSKSNFWAGALVKIEMYNNLDQKEIVGPFI